MPLGHPRGGARGLCRQGRLWRPHRHHRRLLCREWLWTVMVRGPLVEAWSSCVLGRDLETPQEGWASPSSLPRPYDRQLVAAID